MKKLSILMMFALLCSIATAQSQQLQKDTAKEKPIQEYPYRDDLIVINDTGLVWVNTNMQLTPEKLAMYYEVYIRFCKITKKEPTAQGFLEWNYAIILNSRKRGN